MRTVFILARPGLGANLLPQFGPWGRGVLPSAGMQLADFDFVLPPERIAQLPAEPRDSSRLLAYHRATDVVTHHIFHELPTLLQPGDVLVVNDTCVLPARLFTTAGHEILLLRPYGHALSATLVAAKEPLWQCLVRGGKFFTVGARFAIAADFSGEVCEILADGTRVVRFASSDLAADLARHGHTPLPPYIAAADSADVATEKALAERYQTIYAATEKTASVAAPTAGLHFTPELLVRLAERGVQTEKVTLHVGLGTFLPVKTERITDHQMHAEFYELLPAVAERLNRARAAGQRIIAVGTTAARVLETCADGCGRLLPQAGETAIFIYPGYQFRGISGLITNFHLPKSTLFMLVSAFAGREKMLALYREAIEKTYRFYSFGDAMLLL